MNNKLSLSLTLKWLLIDGKKNRLELRLELIGIGTGTDEECGTSFHYHEVQNWPWGNYTIFEQLPYLNPKHRLNP